MKVLSKRQILLVDLLAREKDWLATRRAAKILHISVSTLRRDVEVINDYFSEKNNAIISKPGLGLKLKNNGVLAVPQRSGDELVTGILKSKRLIGITTDLLTRSPTPLSISYLSDKYFISRSSIVEDLKKIHQWLCQFSLAMIRNHTGTFISGSDYDIRLALKEIVTHSVLYHYQMTDSRLDRFSRVQLIKEFGKENVENCINLIAYVEDELECAISEPYYTNLFSHLLVTIRRTKTKVTHRLALESVQTLNNKEWDIAKKAIKWLENKYVISFPIIEVSYVYQYLVSSGKHPVSTVNNFGIQDKSAISYATALINLLSHRLHCDLKSDKVLLNSLVTHIKPMLNRLIFRIVIHNPLLDEIKKELSEVFAAVKAATQQINDGSSTCFPSDDEVAYLTVYIQAAIEKVKERKRIILVCSSGIGTSQLLYSRIIKAFPDWEVVDIVPGNRLKSTLELKQCDLIISTIRIEEMSIPVAYVSALFSTRDISRVAECLCAKKIKRRNHVLNKIILPDLLSKACVVSEMVAENKMEVIEQLTTCLCHEGVISNKQGFIQDVLAREALGSTGFENQIAIPHGKSIWVSETRIAVAKLKHTVDWETIDSSDVKLVILFAVKDADRGTGHIKILARISIALGNDEVVEKLLKADSQEELYQLIISNTGE